MEESWSRACGVASYKKKVEMVGPHPEENTNNNSPTISQVELTRPTQERQTEDHMEEDS